MGTFSLLGNDTIKINDRLLADFGPGEIAKVSYSTDLATVKTGKNGNTIFAQNASGFQATMELKVIRGSADDKYLQSLLTLYKSAPTLYVLDNVEVVKQIGDGLGALTSDTYALNGGIPTKSVEVIVNVEGDTDQALSAYTWVFAGNVRALT